MNSNKHLVALVLSIGISLWLVLMGVNIVTQDFPISDELSTLLSTSLGATVGALAVYLGGKDRDEETVAPEQPSTPNESDSGHADE
jgi:hypothetical protein